MKMPQLNLKKILLAKPFPCPSPATRRRGFLLGEGIPGYGPAVHPLPLPQSTRFRVSVRFSRVPLRPRFHAFHLQNAVGDKFRSRHARRGDQGKEDFLSFWPNCTMYFIYKFSFILPYFCIYLSTSQSDHPSLIFPTPVFSCLSPLFLSIHSYIRFRYLSPHCYRLLVPPKRRSFL